MLVTTRRADFDNLSRIAGREAAIFVVASRFGRIDYRIYEVKVPFVICQYVIGLSIEDVVLPVGIIFPVFLRPEAKTQELFMDFLLRAQTSIRNKLLYQNRTDFAIHVFGKANHTVDTIREILIVCLNSLKEGSKVIVRISEIIKLDDFLSIG